MQSLQSIWQQIETLLAQNISLIPVRDREQRMPDQSVRAAKTPYGSSWKQYQSRIISRDDLFQQMEKYDTTAVAMIAGKVSGNLEVIDVDVKYNPGFDARLFSDLQKFYPDLYAKLRIHKTPSGGYHILYRVWDGIIPGNQKLAGLAPIPTPDNPKPKPTNFLETRGEGGYALLPPSMGYTVLQDRPIPVISWQERCSIISLCKSYNEVVKVDKAPSLPKRDNDYYSTNPFEHYNGSVEAESILLEHGWVFFGENSQWKYFTRPDRPHAGISASFNKSSRLYYIWTTSTQFDSEKWYQPSSVLALLSFNDDRKALYQHLVRKGYGVIKSEVEKKIIQKAATTKKSIPSNLSANALKEYEEAVSEVQDKYPYGTFWVDAENGGYKVSRERLYNVALGLGFYLGAYNQILRVQDRFVHKVSERQFFDTIKKYVKEEDADEYEAVCNAYEAFIQTSGNFTISRLCEFDDTLILRSTKKISYKFYLNGYLSITHQGYIVNSYENLPENSLVFYDTIQQREFKPTTPELIKSCLYYRFLEKAIGISKNLYECIGYYSHEYKDEEGGYFCVLTEQCEDPRAGGGSGKNVFTSMFKNTTTYLNVPGAQIHNNEKFLQSWNFQKVMSISDVPKKFDYLFLKDLSTGSAIVKKLFKDEIALVAKDLPKFIISTNYSYDVSDGGLKRRIIPIEFTDFFTKCGGVNTYFNAMFPDDWSDDDWVGYDNIIVYSIQLFLEAECKLTPLPLTETGWIKQFEQAYGQITHEFIKSGIKNWVGLKYIAVSKFADMYSSFCNDNGVNINFKLSPTMMNKALQDYCNAHNIDFFKSEVLNGEKCKMFVIKSN